MTDDLHEDNSKADARPKGMIPPQPGGYRGNKIVDFLLGFVVYLAAIQFFPAVVNLYTAWRWDRIFLSFFLFTLVAIICFIKIRRWFIAAGIVIALLVAVGVVLLFFQLLSYLLTQAYN